MNEAGVGGAWATRRHGHPAVDGEPRSNNDEAQEFGGHDSEYASDAESVDLATAATAGGGGGGGSRASGNNQDEDDGHTAGHADAPLLLEP